MQLDEEKLAQVEERSDVVIDEPTERQILKHVSTGDRISYIGTDNKFRSGGFVMRVADDGSNLSLSGGNLKWALKTERIQTIFIVKKNTNGGRE
jgi:hypothetical protein